LTGVEARALDVSCRPSGVDQRKPPMERLAIGLLMPQLLSNVLSTSAAK
jgi:hypothetical protein